MKLYPQIVSKNSKASVSVWCLEEVEKQLQPHLSQLVGNNQLLSHGDRLPGRQSFKKHVLSHLAETQATGQFSKCPNSFSFSCTFES